MSEHFFSGYCRRLDASRMVEAECTGGCLTDVDCDFETCPFRPSCSIAKAIEELLSE